MKRTIKRILYTLEFEAEMLVFDDKTDNVIESEEASFLESAVDDIVSYAYGDFNTVKTTAKVIATREDDDEE